VARSTTTTTTRPTRTLGVLVGLLAALYVVIGAGVLWSTAVWTPKLALDLEGGTQIVLRPKPTDGASGAISQTNIDQAVEIIRQRVNGSGVSEAEVTTSGSGADTNIIVSLPGKPDKKTENLVTQAAQLRFRAVLAAAAGAPQPAPTATPTDGATGSPSPSASTSPSASPGVTVEVSPTATTSSNGRAVPRSLLAATTSPTTTPGAAAQATPGASAAPQPKPTDASDVNWIDDALAAQFEALDCSKPENRQGGGGDDPAKPIVACDIDGSAKYLLGPAEVVGTDVTGATFGLEVNSQGVTGTAYEVNLSFTSEGANKFGAVTTRLAALEGVRNQFGIVLDGLVVSAPTTNEPITTGNARITGNFTLDTAQTLANQLKYGALPLSFDVTTKETISATLGSEQLQRGLLAGVIGLLLVVLYSLLQYRALGLVTVASLVIAGAVTYGLVVLLGWRQGYRLSLPGVAGLIVAIGITADSFIVFFERIRDEVRDGRPLGAAVEAAWVRARRTILASDAVSFLAAVVLYLLAVGGVRGFAFTLGLTTVVDLVVVWLFTHPMVAVLARTTFYGQGHRLSGFDPAHLGRSIAYTGRGTVRTPAARTAQPAAAREPEDVFATSGAATRPASGPATRSADGARMTIAERRAAERAARAGDDEPGPDPGSGSGSAAESGATTPGKDA
jgi:preprotein translocase subunit SecD